MPPSKPKKRRILVVEDDPGIRSLEATTLKLAGYEVTEAENGEEGLERLRKRSFDLVILDIMMPGIDGYEFLRRLRDLPARAHIPVIVVTAKGRDASGMVQEASGGADDHIDKPFVPSTLEKAVEVVLAKSPGELKSQRSAQLRIADVYEAVLQLQASAEGEDDVVRVGRLRRARR